MKMKGPCSSATLKTRNRKWRTHMDARLKKLLRRVPDWRRRPGKQIELSIPTEELACKALCDGLGVAKVAKQLGLRISTVRRLAGRLQPHDYNRSVRKIMLNWNRDDLLEVFRRNGVHAADLISELQRIESRRKAQKRSRAAARKRRCAKQKPSTALPLTCP